MASLKGEGERASDTETIEIETIFTLNTQSKTINPKKFQGIHLSDET